jgi:hypothetical protein
MGNNRQKVGSVIAIIGMLAGTYFLFEFIASTMQ